MAVCNLFDNLRSTSGNFMLFSQYVEDITHNYTEGDNWKVIPTKFVALNIDFSKIDKNIVLNSQKENLNSGIPKYFQNCFENACAYGRTHYKEWCSANEINNKEWNSDISRNLFWNCMFNGKLLNIKKYGESDNTNYIPEVVYYGDINMHSYNEHKGMGYGEIYCYIPTNAEKMQCQVVINSEKRLYDDTNDSMFLEGYTDKYVEDYIQHYYYNRDFSMSFDDNDVSKLMNSSDSKYTINTIVVLYSIFRKLNNDWEVIYDNIPMGMYIAGKFDDNNQLTNSITKYVTTNYDSGTSYGLRICTRFSANPSGVILYNTDLTTDDSGYANICQLMTAMNENLYRMMDISKSAINTTQQYKDLLSIVKNNRTNVPYVKDVNGVDCWFVNGKFISAVNKGVNVSCTQLSPETIQKRLDNLSDNDETNDYTPITDPNSCDCDEIGIREVAIEFGLDPEDYPEHGGPITPDPGECDCDFVIAEQEEVINSLHKN